MLIGIFNNRMLFNSGDIRKLYQKLGPMHVTNVLWFDRSAVFESFWYKNLAPNRAAFYSMQVSGIP